MCPISIMVPGSLLILGGTKRAKKFIILSHGGRMLPLKFRYRHVKKQDEQEH